jgi:hypothetical protein
LLDAGLPFEELRRALGSLAVEGWDVSADRVIKTELRQRSSACMNMRTGTMGSGSRTGHITITI